MSRLNHKSNYQDALKVIAIITMIIDHLGLYLFPSFEIFRVVGRIAMPIFCFFAGYNFKNSPRPIIFLAGLLLYTSSMILFNQFITINILITIFLGQGYIFLFKKQLQNFDKGYWHVILLGILWPFNWFIIDYGSIGIAIMVLGYIAKNDPKNLKLTSLVTVSLLFMHSMVTFNFSGPYLILTIIVCILEYILLTYEDYNLPIEVNLRPITRHSLLIYFVQLIIFELAFYYVWVLKALI